MFVGSYDLRSVSRREALDIIRSCDQLSVDVKIARTATIQKPVPQVAYNVVLILVHNNYNAGAYVASVKPGSQYDAGAYVASVASSLVHNMTLELT